MCTARGVCVFTQVVGMSHVTSIAQFAACVCVIRKGGEEEAVCMQQVCTVHGSVTSWAVETGPADITNGINSESKRIKCGGQTLSRQQTTDNRRKLTKGTSHRPFSDGGISICRCCQLLLQNTRRKCVRFNT